MQKETAYVNARWDKNGSKVITIRESNTMQGNKNVHDYKELGLPLVHKMIH